MRAGRFIPIHFVPICDGAPSLEVLSKL